MDVAFDRALAAGYSSNSQIIRVLSETWVTRQLYCPGCGEKRMRSYANNSKVADFRCDSCVENFELKSHKARLGRALVDGAYGAMMERLRRDTNPNFLVLHYDPKLYRVMNLLLIPSHFFVTDIIECRRPLAATARRAGWVGCNIVIEAIPQAGRIHLIRDGQPAPRQAVMAQWRAMTFLRQSRTVESRGWLLAVMRCIDRLGAASFALRDVYRFEQDLQVQFPSNRNVRPKIRQQLQVLRDKGYLEFLGDGTYRLTGPRV
jgi:type II restriction enzyme